MRPRRASRPRSASLSREACLKMSLLKGALLLHSAPLFPPERRVFGLRAGLGGALASCWPTVSRMGAERPAAARVFGEWGWKFT